jgi:hypothetical protein
MAIAKEQEMSVKERRLRSKRNCFNMSQNVSSLAFVLPEKAEETAPESAHSECKDRF